MKTTNNIPKLLKKKEMSIKRFGEKLEMDYSPTHRLVRRENLLSTPLETLLKVAEILNVNIEELYKD